MGRERWWKGIKNEVLGKDHMEIRDDDREKPPRRHGASSSKTERVRLRDIVYNRSITGERGFLWHFRPVYHGNRDGLERLIKWKLNLLPYNLS